MQKSSNSLNLSDCFIGDDGCSLLSSFLKENPSVHSIDLRGNSISAEGLKQLAQAFRSSVCLKSISLEWNNIGDSVHILLDSLALCPALQSVDLRNNRIGAEGAGAIASFIELTNSVYKLDLRWNELGTLGGRRILQALNRNKSVKVLELAGNKIAEDVLIEIEDALFGKIERKTERNEEEGRTGRGFNEEILFKYETLLASNSKNEVKVGEMEILLEHESRKVQDLKSEFYKEIEAEKSRRIFSDESLIVFKEESLKRDLDNQRMIQELETKLNSVSSEKNALSAEYENLQILYENFISDTQAKIRNSDEKLISQERQARISEENLKNLLEQNKRKYEEILFETKSELQSTVDKLSHVNTSLNIDKDSLESEIQSLRSQINYLKQEYEENLKKTEILVREDENRKSSLAARGYESRIQNLEESRESLVSKIKEMQKDFSASERKFAEQISVLESSASLFREEKKDLVLHLQNISSQRDGLQNDLYLLKGNLEKSQKEASDLGRALRDRKDAHASQIEKILAEHSQEKRVLDESRDALSSQLRVLESDFGKVRRDRDRVLSQFETLNDLLKQKVMSLIQDTVQGHVRRIEKDI